MIITMIITMITIMITVMISYPKKGEENAGNDWEKSKASSQRVFLLC